MASSREMKEVWREENDDLKELGPHLLALLQLLTTAIQHKDVYASPHDRKTTGSNVTASRFKYRQLDTSDVIDVDLDDLGGLVDVVGDLTTTGERRSGSRTQNCCSPTWLRTGQWKRPSSSQRLPSWSRWMNPE